MKKKFTFPMDNDFKLDLAYIIKQSEMEFKKIAEQIFIGVEPDNDKPIPFDIRDLYKEREVPKEKTKPNKELVYHFQAQHH